jgi:hypothetical protein
MQRLAEAKDLMQPTQQGVKGLSHGIFDNDRKLSKDTGFPIDPVTHLESRGVKSAFLASLSKNYQYCRN